MLGVKEKADSLRGHIKNIKIRIKRKSVFLKYKADGLIFPWKTRLFCPCCGLRFRKFVAGDYQGRGDLYNTERYRGIRQDILCPFCESLPRHRILALWCEANKKRLRSSSVLYFAPEHGMLLWLRRNGVKFTSADLYDAYADLKLDIQNTGLPDDTYDIIFCNHVLEHVDDFRRALREQYRILKPGGLFVCSFPMDPKVELLDEDPELSDDATRLQKYGQADHRRVFGMKAGRFLREAGFAVQKIRGESCPEAILPVVGPADYDMNILFCCRKPAAKAAR